MQFLLPLVVKTTNLKAQTRINSEVKASHLLIYKGKVFIGSFGYRNDCTTVHFNCQKRRDSGFPPLEQCKHKNTACRVWWACRLWCVHCIIQPNRQFLKETLIK